MLFRLAGESDGNFRANRSDRYVAEGVGQQVFGVAGAERERAASVPSCRNAPASTPPHARPSAHHLDTTAASRGCAWTFYVAASKYP